MMAEEDRSDSGTDDFFDDGEEADDDEATLDEEEMLEGNDDYEDELRNLQDDADLPVEELRRRYYGGAGIEDEYRSSDEAQSTSTQDASVSRDTSGEVLEVSADSSAMISTDKPGPSTPDDSEQKHESHGYFSDVEDTEEDTDYVPPDPWRREVREGPGYQANVPDCPSFTSPYTGQERGSLLWSPVGGLDQENIDKFLKEFYKLAFLNSESSKSADLSRCNGFEERQPVKDDENALKALMDANYNADEALLRFPFAKINAPQISAPAEFVKLSEEECLLFEDGIRFFGKNFGAIHRMKLPHRTVGELVHFYYIWKKTERHDVFVEKTRVQERPNCTDFMGRLIGHMDATTGDSTEHLSGPIEFSTATIPSNLDIISTKAWGDCWQEQTDTSPLPHLDNETIANVLQ